MRSIVINKEIVYNYVKKIGGVIRVKVMIYVCFL